MTTVDKCQSALITAVVVGGNGEGRRGRGGRGGRVGVGGPGARALWMRVEAFNRGWMSGLMGRVGSDVDG